MKPLLLVALSLSALTGLARAQAPIAALPTPPVPAPSPLEIGEIALEGEVKAINGANGEITILATAFSTPTGRKTLPAPKAKTLVTTATTRFLDLRLNLGYALSDLNIGLQVRAVGRDTGSGKPMQVRLLEWRSTQPPIPPDPDTPASIASLLPPPQDSKGVKVRVIDAGFQPENRVFGWSQEGRPVFFVSYRVLAPRDSKTNRPYYEWGDLKGVRSPDGTFLRSSGAGWNGKTGVGRTLSFPQVNPRWKSVTALFETTSPDAKPDSSGVFRAFYPLVGALPTKAKPKTEPKTRLETPRGTVLVLESIECDFQKKTSTYKVSFEKPDDVPDASVDISLSSVSDERGRNLKTGSSYSNNNGELLSIAVPGVPEEGAKEARLNLEVVEQAEAWKQKDAYNTIEVELPVAALLKANPPGAPAEVAPPTDKNQGALPSWNAENEQFSARLEEVQRSDNLLGLVWIAPKIKTDANAVQTLVETVAVPVALRARDAAGKMSEVSLFGEESDHHFFRSDGSVPKPGETATRFNANGNFALGDETAFSLDVRTFKRLNHDLDLKGVAVSPDSQRALDEPIGDGSLMLRKIAWLSGDALDKIALRTGGQLELKGNRLVLVFARTPIMPDAKLKLNSVSIQGTTNQGQVWTTWDGDALSGETNGALTVVMPAPTDGAKSLDIRLRATESGPDEATSTIELAGVKWQKYKG